MTTTNQSKRYLGNRSVYFGPDLPETDLEEGFLFYKTGTGLHVYRNGSWSIVESGGLGYTPVNKAGDTMTGLLTLSGNPTSNLHAATKQYVDGLIVGGGVTSFNTRGGAVTLQASDITSIDGSGSGIDADLLDGQHASAFALSGHDHTGVYSPVGHTHTGTYLSTDMNYNNIGSVCLVAVNNMAQFNPGTTISGSFLSPCGLRHDMLDPESHMQVYSSGGALSGTWRILGFVPINSSVLVATLAQRIA